MDVKTNKQTKNKLPYRSFAITATKSKQNLCLSAFVCAYLSRGGGGGGGSDNKTTKTKSSKRQLKLTMDCFQTEQTYVQIVSRKAFDNRQTARDRLTKTKQTTKTFRKLIIINFQILNAHFFVLHKNKNKTFTL